MAHLGRNEFAVLMHLSTNGRQAAEPDGAKTSLGGESFRTAVVDFLVTNGLVARSQNGEAVECELSDAGRVELDNGLAMKWVVDHSGLHEESKTYRFEVPDQVTGMRFVVSVAEEAGPALANKVAYSVIAAPSIKKSCRKLDTLGPEGGFPVSMAIEGTGEVSIWRKL